MIGEVWIILKLQGCNTCKILHMNFLKMSHKFKLRPYKDKKNQHHHHELSGESSLIRYAYSLSGSVICSKSFCVNKLQRLPVQWHNVICEHELNAGRLSLTAVVLYVSQ